MDTLEDYVRTHLSAEMRHHRGNKRIRKKRAKAALRRRRLFLGMAAPIARRLDYAEVYRRVVVTEPVHP